MGGGPKGYRSDTGGVTPMNIGGRMIFERERLFNLTDQERAWRAQFVKDLQLAHGEPKHVPELYKELYNPIRRFYRAPLDKLEAYLRPKFGAAGAEFTRVCIGRGFLTLGLAYYAMYYFTYQRNTWERNGGWRIYTSKPVVLPGDPNYPQPNLDHPPSYYVDRARGFTENTPNF